MQQIETKNLLLSLGMLAILVSTSAPAHQHMKGPDLHPAEGNSPGIVARPGDDNETTGKGIKIDRPGMTGIPCGEGAAAVPASNQLVAGQTATITVFATIQHAGHEFLAIANNSNPQQDSDFTYITPTSAVYKDAAGNKTNKTLVNATYHSQKLMRVGPAFVDLDKACASPGCTITVTFTVPNVMCTPPSCTLQWTEQMEDGGGPGPYTFYKSCADVTIAGASVTPTPSATPTVTPNPTPTPSPTPTPGANPLPNATPVPTHNCD